MRGAVLTALLLTLAGCAASPAPHWQPPIGPNPVFDQVPASAPDHRLIVTDLVLGPNAVGAAHYHPWEEFLYVIEGSALLEMEGQPTRTLLPGEKFVIPSRVHHTPRAGPEGVRAIVVRVHREGDPVSTPVETPAGQ